jgi:basic amino acid/polyamine antiporter, APA family
MAEPKQMFARKASGVVRSVSLFDAFIFGLTLAIPFAANFFLFPFYTYFLPGASWTIAIILGFIISIPTYFVYAGLGSMMPRSGGDYVFQSRGVHPTLSMVSALFWQVFLLQPVYGTLLLYSSASLGLVPLFTMIGAVTGNTSVSSFATWLGGQTGLFVFTACMIIVAIVNNVVGIKWVARAQRWILFPATIISGIVIPYLLFSTSSATYQNNFNHYTQILNGTSNAYTTILHSATAPSYSLVNTLLLAVVISISFLMWSVWTAPIFGEIKGASNFRAMLVTFLAGGAFVGFLLMLPELVGFQNMAGYPFTYAIAAASYTLTPALSFYPSLGILTLMTTNNVVLMVLASLGYVAAGYFFVQLMTSNLSRYLLAASIDGTMPLFFSSTNARFRTPVKGLIFVFAVIMIFAASIDLAPQFFTTKIFSLIFWETIAIWTSSTLFFGTSLAAILMPRTNKSMFKSSPIARYGPLLSICGAITFIISVFVLIGYLVIPQLNIGLGASGGSIIVLVAAGAIIWYFAFKRYQASKGIDVGMAYRELPPE